MDLPSSLLLNQRKYGLKGQHKFYFLIFKPYSSSLTTYDDCVHPPDKMLGSAILPNCCQEQLAARLH